jgi:hypothetical protein
VAAVDFQIVSAEGDCHACSVARQIRRFATCACHMLEVQQLSTLFCVTHQVGFEPTTLRLTACRLMYKNKGFPFAFSGLNLKSIASLYPALLPFFIPPR